jgi:electron transport complex protein RnfG
MLRFIIVLATVCVVAALVLGGVNSITKPLIAAQKEKELNQALKDIMPEADGWNKKTFSGGDYYRCYKGKKAIGYTISAIGEGYSGDIRMLVGIDNKGKITGIEVLSQAETPGLGAKCIEIKHGERRPWFLAQFIGKSADNLQLKAIEAITGATITSEAIVDGIREYAADFLKEIK